MLTGHSGSNAHFISPPSASMNNKQKSHPMEDWLGIPFPIAVAYCGPRIRDRGEDVAFWYLPPFRLSLPWHFCHPPWLPGRVLVANSVNLSLHLWPPTKLDKLIWCSVDTKRGWAQPAGTGWYWICYSGPTRKGAFAVSRHACDSYIDTVDMPCTLQRPLSYWCWRNVTFKLRAPGESRLYRNR